MSTPSLIPSGISEQEFAAHVDLLRTLPGAADALVEMLAEESPLYAGRGTNQVTRMRGYVLASFAEVGLPEAALPSVMEELESGIHPYAVAAAARALRGCETFPAQATAFLLRALERFQDKDQTCSFAVYAPDWPLPEPTSTVREILRTCAVLDSTGDESLNRLIQLQAHSGAYFAPDIQVELSTTIASLKASAAQIPNPNPAPSTPPSSCCGSSAPLGFNTWTIRSKASLVQVQLEDQAGEVTGFTQFFNGGPSIVAFFYTRCENPEKCSLTISKLAQLQRTVRESKLDGQLKITGISYDAGYDAPQHLKLYGEERGLEFTPTCRLFRVRAGFDDLKAHLKLGVNFNRSLVNHHRIELYLLDDQGRVAHTFTRLQWNTDEVFRQAVELVTVGTVKKDAGFSPAGNQVPGRNSKMQIAFRTGQSMLHSLGSAALPFGIAFFPKCPFCWAAYLSVFGISGLSRIPYSPWLLPLMFGMMLVNLIIIFKRCRRNNILASFYISLLGTFLVLIPGLVFSARLLLNIGVVMIGGGALLSGLPVNLPGIWNKITIRRMKTQRTMADATP